MALQAKGLLKVSIKLYSCCAKSTTAKAFYINRSARFIGKLLAENAAERRQWNKGLPTTKIYGSSSLSPKRLETLNRLFLANITDGLTTSTCCQQLADLGLQISRAELSKCGQSLKVFWSSHSTGADEEVAKLLRECHGELRSNIVAKSVGGFIPHLIFTKDLEVTCARDVDHLLQLPAVVKDLQAEIPAEDDDRNEENTEDRFNVPISTNVVGLRRDEILRRVIATAKRLKKAERRKQEEGCQEPVEETEDLPDRLAKIDVRCQKSAIGAFMRKQKKLERENFANTLGGFRDRKEFLEELHAGGYGADADEDELDFEIDNETDEDFLERFNSDESGGSYVDETDSGGSEKRR